MAIARGQDLMVGTAATASADAARGHPLSNSPPSRGLYVTHIFGALLLLKKMQRFLVSAPGWGSRNVGAPLRCALGMGAWLLEPTRLFPSPYPPPRRAQQAAPLRLPDARHRLHRQKDVGNA